MHRYQIPSWNDYCVSYTVNPLYIAFWGSNAAWVQNKPKLGPEINLVTKINNWIPHFVILRLLFWYKSTKTASICLSFCQNHLTLGLLYIINVNNNAIIQVGILTRIDCHHLSHLNRWNPNHDVAMLTLSGHRNWLWLLRSNVLRLVVPFFDSLKRS